ncbi:hypothetical protein ACFOEK_14340 [Litoribrevibacter euphylliae]|uniref:Uncharacterized protein n=1 Tax=Litoribrevibacter euphylliae TaxID=1834034 RepID=A0ABV7HHY2_9GAMM
MKKLISAFCLLLLFPVSSLAEEANDQNSDKQYGLILGGFSYHWSEEPKDKDGNRKDFNEVHNTLGALVRFYEEDDIEIDWAATIFTDSYDESAWAVRRTWGKAYHFEHVKVVPKLAGMITKKRTSYKDDESKIFPAIAPMMYVGNEHVGAEFLLFPWFDGFGYVEFEVLF